MSNFTEIWNPNAGDLGVLYTLDEFLEEIEVNALIDDDGFGNPAILFEGQYLVDPDIEIYPSDVDESVPEDATHIIWYNR